MFGLDPFSRPVAIIEILLLLAFAAFVGWLLGRLVLNSRIRALRATIAEQQAELNNYQRSAATPSPTRPVSRPESVTQTPAPLSLNSDDSDGVNRTIMDAPDSIAADATPINQLAAAPTSPVSVTAEVPGNSEAAVLNRIAARAGEINFDRIGRAIPAEADDLKDIIGVGPFLERKLHSLGIYTFRQVANFTKEDADKINSIIEFFPGRIERDNWVDQSKAFHERKYGRRG